MNLRKSVPCSNQRPLGNVSDIVDAIKAATSGDDTLKKSSSAYEAGIKRRGAREAMLSLEQALKRRDKNTVQARVAARQG
ncbi:MAG: hypothetical protein LQ338_005781 [Usnochroma carphineum]|nr:MAG: hypothetical protein LQ338_005781 [Usnochroma carphineum]